MSFHVTISDPKRIKKEREKARALRKTAWWREKIQKGLCHYCSRNVGAKNLTMDHVVPLARGGSSTKGNLVATCFECNRKKGLEIPVERILKGL